MGNMLNIILVSVLFLAGTDFLFNRLLTIIYFRSIQVPIEKTLP